MDGEEEAKISKLFGRAQHNFQDIRRNDWRGVRRGMTMKTRKF